MKRIMILTLMLLAVLCLAVGCLYWLPMHSQRPGTNRDALGTTDTVPEPIDGLNPETILDGPDGTSTHAFRGSQNTDDRQQDAPLIAMARLGSYDNMEALRRSERYRQLCQTEPALAHIDHAAVDLGEGDWWYIKPLAEHMSMAINEYTFEMFMGEQDERDGQILLRTEEAEPILIRMSTYDPGSVQIHLVASDGRTLYWIPTETPTEGELRTVPEVAMIR